MTHEDARHYAALGLVVGGLVAAGVLGGAAWGTRAQPAAPRWEEFQRPGGITCLVYRGTAMSCFYDPPPVSGPPRPGAW